MAKSRRQTSRQTMFPGMSADEEPRQPADAGETASGDGLHGEAVEVSVGSAAAENAAPAAQPAPEAADPLLDGASVWVVDANSLIFQVFHAIPEMTSPKGEPVNAVFGFGRDMLRLILHKAPDYLFVALDPPGKTFRDELYPEYKATRAKMPDDLSPQFPKILQLLEALAIPVLMCEGYEADDVLATVARRAAQQGGYCYLVTSDKDCRQLISDRVQLYNPRKDQTYDAAALLEDWGVRPDQVVDYQALVGDAVDNIPGVPLIGPKAARELLEKYDTLEGILEHLDELKGKRRENLQTYGEQARASRQLAALHDEVPIAIDWEAGKLGRFDRQRFLALMQEWGFRTMAQQLDAIAPEPRVAAPRGTYRLVTDEAALRALAAELSRQRQLSLDTETTDTRPMCAELVGLSFAWRAGEGVYVPVRCPPDEHCLPKEVVLEALRGVLENPQIAKVGQNLKYDVLVLRRCGIAVRGLWFDTMLASYLLEAGTRSHNLDQLALRYLNYRTISIKELIGTGKQQKRMDEVPLAAVCDYAGEDADIALRLAEQLQPRLEEAGLWPLFAELEMPLIDVLVEMEFNGFRVDVDRLRALSAGYQQRLEELRGEIYELAGHEFNIDSPKQLSEVLFVEHKLPVGKRTRTGASTDAGVLEDLAANHDHPLPRKIIEYRQFAKLKGTYVDALPALVNPQTGRVHASFNQVVAATGRLSSSDPNLQNIPIRTAAGREIRSAFLPREADWQLLAADYSQIELRILAHYSNDDELCAAFERDEDIHARVASQVFGVPLAEVSSEMRRRAKAVNFGVIYGLSAFGLARQLGIEQSEAAGFIESYFARYAGVARFLVETLEKCQSKGYVRTILGRRREIRGIRSTDWRHRNLPERTAVNTVIQGSAADLIKQAMVAVFRRLRQENFAARLLLQIHDELIFEAPAAEIAALEAMVGAEMSGVMRLRVPLKVDLKSGAHWAALE